MPYSLTVLQVFVPAGSDCKLVSMVPFIDRADNICNYSQGFAAGPHDNQQQPIIQTQLLGNPACIGTFLLASHVATPSYVSVLTWTGS